MGEAAALSRRAQRDGRAVVLCHGCFDIVHPGHLRHLLWARKQGDLLIVSITADAGISKGLGRPLVTEDLRAENLAALECVDLVVISHAPTAVDTIREIKPNTYVKGAEYREMHDPRLAAERDAVASFGGRVLFSTGDVVYSSTGLIGRFGDEWPLKRERVSGYTKRHGVTLEGVGALLRGARGLRCLVVGDVILDEYVHCDATHIAGEAPMMNATLLRRERFMGGAAIIAQHLRCLGADVHLGAPVGTDRASRALRAVCRNAGVQLLPVKHGARTPRKRRFVSRGHKLLKLDDPPGAAFGAAEVDRFMLRIGAATTTRSWDLVAIVDFGYGALAQGTLQRLIDLLRPRTRIMVGDVSGPRADLLSMRGFDLLLPNESELRSAMRGSAESPAALAGQLARETDAKGVVVTLGEDGLVAFDGATRDAAGRLVSDYLPSFTDRAVDPLGCGDALLSGAGLTMAAGGSMFEGAFVGSLAAAMEAETPGNRPIMLEALLQRAEADMEAALAPRGQPPAARGRQRAARAPAA